MQQTLLPFCLNGSATELDLSDPAPAPAPKRQRRVTGSRMGCMYAVPVPSITKSELNQHTKDLTMVPIDNGYNGSGPVAFDAYILTERNLFVPRFYGFKHFGPPETLEVHDGLCHGRDRLSWQAEPDAGRSDEHHARCAAHEPFGAMLILPCGYGKTVCALFIAHACDGARSCWSKGVSGRPVARARQGLPPDATIGTIRQNHASADADIVVGLVQSISKREYPSAS